MAGRYGHAVPEYSVVSAECPVAGHTVRPAVAGGDGGPVVGAGLPAASPGSRAGHGQRPVSRLRLRRRAQRRGLRLRHPRQRDHRRHRHAGQAGARMEALPVGGQPDVRGGRDGHTGLGVRVRRGVRALRADLRVSVQLRHRPADRRIERGARLFHHFPRKREDFPARADRSAARRDLLCGPRRIYRRAEGSASVRGQPNGSRPCRSAA